MNDKETIELKSIRKKGNKVQPVVGAIQRLIDELSALERGWSSYSQGDRDVLSGRRASVIQDLTQASENLHVLDELSEECEEYKLQDPHSWGSEKVGKGCTLALRAGLFAIFIGALWGAIAQLFYHYLLLPYMPHFA